MIFHLPFTLIIYYIYPFILYSMGVMNCSTGICV